MNTVRVLSAPAMEGREVGSAGSTRAARWIAGEFRAVGLQPLEIDFAQPFPIAGYGKVGTNLIGICHSASLIQSEVVVVSAHYDHLGIENGVLYPGADDNASGVAVLLELARLCRGQFRHDIVFAAFDAEEIGLLGSRHFVARAKDLKVDIALNVNLDMVSRGSAATLFAAGAKGVRALRNAVEAVRVPGVRIEFGHDAFDKSRRDWSFSSDHASFAQANIPFVYFGVEDHPDYHRHTDTAEAIDRQFFQGAAEAILGSLVQLDRIRFD